MKNSSISTSTFGPRVVVHHHILLIVIPLRSNALDATSLNTLPHVPTVVIQPIERATIPIASRVCSASNVQGRSRWTCKKCGTDNPMASTFGQLYPKGFCFIATATFESVDAPEVVFLREFRDITLLNNSVGKAFVQLYYQYSPPIARVLESSQVLRQSSRIVLSTLVRFLKHNWRR